MRRTSTTVIVAAATHRAAGRSWEQVRDALAAIGYDVTVDYLRKWPGRYKDVFQPAYDQAEAELWGEAAAEARHVLRAELRQNDNSPRTRIAAAAHLARADADRARIRMDRATRAASAIEVTPTRIVVSFGAPAVADQEADDGAE